MIISHKYKFIFIKTMKTAGTSIEVFLSRHCGPDDIVTTVFPDEPGHEARNYTGLFNPLPTLIAAKHGCAPSRLTTIRHLAKRVRFYNHMSAFSVRSRVPKETWNSYFKFCVEREPHDKTKSLFRMLRDRDEISDMQEIFDRGLLPTDWDRYSDPYGRPLVDRILKYENLDAELGTVMEGLGVPFPGTLKVKAKAINTREATPRKAIDFTQAQEATLRDVFRREFETLYPDS